MRKIWLFSIAAGLLLLGSCKKDNSCAFRDSSQTAPEIERVALADSLEKHGIRNALQHPSGFYYQIEQQGSGPFIANLCNSVTVDYWGGFFNGNGFDSSRSSTFTLGQVVVGWQKALPLVNQGGKINIYIPPSLGFGNTPRPGPGGEILIPSNSYLVFKVEVLKIQ